MNFLGIHRLGVNPENGTGLLLSFAFIPVVLVASAVLRRLVGLVQCQTDQASIQMRFWTRLATTVRFLVGTQDIRTVRDAMSRSIA